MIPSVKTLATITVDYEGAKRVRQILEGTPEYSRCISMALETCSGYIRHANGSEYIGRGRNAKSPAISYANAGDPYVNTLMFVWTHGIHGGVWRVGCWGDIVERGNYE